MIKTVVLLNIFVETIFFSDLMNRKWKLREQLQLPKHPLHQNKGFKLCWNCVALKKKKN